MREKQVREISENTLLLFPLLKYLLKGDPGDPAFVPFRNQTYHILRVLESKGPLPISAIGKQLFIAKQNMTTLIDRLMDDGLVDRKGDPADRRVINITITGKGIEFLKESLAALKKIIKKNLSGLSEEEIEALSSGFRTIRTVVSQLKRREQDASA